MSQRKAFSFWFAVLALGLSFTLAAQTGQKLIVNHFVSDPEAFETHLVITDVDGVGPNIKVSLFNEDGRLVYEQFETLHAFGKLNYNPVDYLQKYQHGFNQKPIFRGTIRIESQGGAIAGQYWQFSKNAENSFMNIAIPTANGITAMTRNAETITSTGAARCTRPSASRGTRSSLVISLIASAMG